MTTQVMLGSDKESAREVYLDSDARWLGTYVIGIQGMGKSNLLKQIALTDIANGEGVCVISPHPDLVQDILMRIPEERADDVIVLDPSDDCPVGLNIFEWDGPQSGIPIDKIADDVVTNTFKFLWADSWGPRMEEMLSNVSRTILLAQSLPEELRPTLAEFELIVGRGKQTEYRHHLMRHITDQHETRAVDLLVRYWEWFDEQDARFQEQIASSTLNKARPFAANELVAHVVGQGPNKVDFRSIMDDGMILLIDLNVDKLGVGNVGLLGSLLVGRLFLTALSRETDPPSRRFHILADEFGYFATPAFAVLQDQARKFGVDVLVAHQRRGQLDIDTKDATRTARNWVVFNVNPEDASELSEAFDSTPPPQLDDPEYPIERQALVHASYPWDELKQNGHEDAECLRLQSEIQEFVDPLRHEMFASIKRQGETQRIREPKILEVSVTKEIVEELFSERSEFIRTSALAHDRITLNLLTEKQKPLFERRVNWFLHLMMKGESKELTDPLLYELGESLFIMSTHHRFFYDYDDSVDPGATWDRCFPEEYLVFDWMERGDTPGMQHFPLAPDAGKTSLSRIRDWFTKVSAIYAYASRKLTWQDVLQPGKIGNMDRKTYFDIKLVDISSIVVHLERIASFYAVVLYRGKIINAIADLGSLLYQRPIWVRGGQPQVDMSNLSPFRPRSDVTKEWKNRFAHLPQFEAWCRIQEDREIREYHIATTEIKMAPENGKQTAKLIRKASQDKWGVRRRMIERALGLRSAGNEGSLQTSETLID